MGVFPLSTSRGGSRVSGLSRGWEGRKFDRVVRGNDEMGKIFNNDEGTTDFRTT